MGSLIADDSEERLKLRGGGENEGVIGELGLMDVASRCRETCRDVGEHNASNEIGEGELGWRKAKIEAVKGGGEASVGLAAVVILLENPPASFMPVVCLASPFIIIKLALPINNTVT